MRDWIVETVQGMGVVGVGLLMFLENIFPPLPSEIIMPLVGYLASRGEMSFGGAIAAGASGSLLGATFWYVVGRMLTRDRLCSWIGRHGAWLAMTPRDVDRAGDWFGRHGKSSVFFGRLVPVVRTLISVPAGFTRMSVPLFLLFSALGTTVWTAALAYAGRLLGQQFDQVENYIGLVSWAVIIGAVVWYAYRVARIRTSESPPAG